MVIFRSCFLKHSIQVTTRVRKRPTVILSGRNCFPRSTVLTAFHKTTIISKIYYKNCIQITHQLNCLMPTTQCPIIWHVFVFLFHVLTWSVYIIATFMVKNQTISCLRLTVSDISYQSFDTTSLRVPYFVFIPLLPLATSIVSFTIHNFH